MKIAIVGKGHVGTSLGAGLTRTGHRDPEESVFSAANWGELIIMAAPFGEVKNAVQEIGPATEGKVLIDVTNPLDQNMDLAIGFSALNAEEVQKMLPGARVIKAFNTALGRTRAMAGPGGNR
jgi:predicted dinucleotide-binding enzyme